MKFFASIRARLILLALLLLVPATLYILWAAYDSYHLRLADAKRSLLATASQARGTLQNDVRELQRLIGLLSHVPAVREFQAQECSMVLASLLAHDEYTNLLALDTKGDNRCDALASSTVAQNFADRDYFDAALRGPGPVVGKPLVGRVSGKPALPVAVALKNPDGRAAGVLVSAIDLAVFSKRFLSEQPASDAVFLMWDRAGNLLFRYLDAEKISG